MKRVTTHHQDLYLLIVGVISIRCDHKYEKHIKQQLHSKLLSGLAINLLEHGMGVLQRVKVRPEPDPEHL